MPPDLESSWNNNFDMIILDLDKICVQVLFFSFTLAAQYDL